MWGEDLYTEINKLAPKNPKKGKLKSKNGPKK